MCSLVRGNQLPIKCVMNNNDKYYVHFGYFLYLINILQKLIKKNKNKTKQKYHTVGAFDQNPIEKYEKRR